MREGQIYKIHSDFYYVDDGSENYTCKIKEVLKKQKEKILVGDFVEFSAECSEQSERTRKLESDVTPTTTRIIRDGGVIHRVIKRKNYISRPSVANIDQIIIVSALKEPDLDLHQLNRYIALAKYFNIIIKLCFNKDDLRWDKKLREKITSIYEPLGFEIVFTSATSQNGIKTFEKLLEGKTTVLCGNSGVGKSSIINAISPHLNLKTKAVSEKTQRGTHTTRHCEIIKLNSNSRIVDTPGFSNVRFDFILPVDVDLLFDDIAKFRDNCKFRDCLHINEGGCNVLLNLDKIDNTRYESYLQFIEEAREYKEKVKAEGKKIETTTKTFNNREIVKISDKKRQSGRNTMKQGIYKELDNE